MQQYPNRQKVYMEPLPFHGYKVRPLQIQIGLGCVLLVLKANVGSDTDVLGKFLLFTLFRGAAPSSSEQLRAALVPCLTLNGTEFKANKSYPMLVFNPTPISETFQLHTKCRLSV